MGTNFPYNFCNRMGIAMFESASVTVGTDNITIELANRSFRWLNQKGVILFRLNQEIPAAGAALPVMFSVNDFKITGFKLFMTPPSVSLLLFGIIA